MGTRGEECTSLRRWVAVIEGTSGSSSSSKRTSSRRSTPQQHPGSLRHPGHMSGRVPAYWYPAVVEPQGGHILAKSSLFVTYRLLQGMLYPLTLLLHQNWWVNFTEKSVPTQGIDRELGTEDSDQSGGAERRGRGILQL